MKAYYKGQLLGDIIEEKTELDVEQFQQLSTALSKATEGLVIAFKPIFSSIELAMAGLSALFSEKPQSIKKEIFIRKKISGRLISYKIIKGNNYKRISIMKIN